MPSCRARSWIRRIFSTVFAPHEPALTVGSFAISATARPAISPTPVTTPSAPRPSSSQLASSASSAKLPSSSSADTRSRTPSLPCSRAFSRWCSGPPASARSLARRRALTSVARASPRQPPVAMATPSRQAALVADLKPRMHHIEVGPRTEKPPGVAHDRQQREGDHPSRPEAPTRPGGHPDAHADGRHAQRASGLLQQATAKVRLALAQREPGRGRADRQVRLQPIQIRASSRPIGAPDPLLELLGREPPGDRVLAQLIDHLLTVGVGNAKLGRIAHRRTLFTPAQHTAGRALERSPRRAADPLRSSLPWVSTDEAFDLPAAALRADGAELAQSVALLAARLEQALPQIAQVERRRVGGFRSKRREVQRIAVVLGDEQFELRPIDGRVQCTRHKVVRGITLSRQELAMSDWINELVAAVGQSAEISERDRLALGELLR